MATARDIFNNAVALTNDISASGGGPDMYTTADYEARAPYLINLLQTELVHLGGVFKTVDITIPQPSSDPVELPADVDEVKHVFVVSGGPAYAARIEFGAVYTLDDFTGVIRVIYIPKVAGVKSLDDEVLNDSEIVTAMTYGLAVMLIANEGDDPAVAFLRREYDRSRMALSRRVRAIKVPVVDVYNFQGV
jgi:hypothetical protein